VAAIREIDMRHIIILEGDDLARKFSGLKLPSDNNLMLSSHNYSRYPKDRYPGEIDGERWDKERMRRELEEHEGFQCAQKYGAPLLAGEFDGPGNPGSVRGYADQVDLFEEYGIHYTSWSYKTAQFGMQALRPESEYMRLLKPVMSKAAFFSPCPSEESAQILALMKQTAKACGDALGITDPELRFINENWTPLWFSDTYYSRLLQHRWVDLFREMSCCDIDRVMDSWRLENCVENPQIEAMKEGFMRGGGRVEN
jgi:hypothetical protein